MNTGSSSSHDNTQHDESNLELYFNFKSWSYKHEEDSSASSVGPVAHSQLQEEEPSFLASPSSQAPLQLLSRKTLRQRRNYGTKLKVAKKVAFKTKTDKDILDDGYKWRKYGKKMVKNCPNPRNYFRCSVNGCPVKKTVQRDKDDQSYVITAYIGQHIHDP